MLNLLNWDKSLKVNGKIYPNSQVAWEELKDCKEEIQIQLNFLDEPKDLKEVEPSLDYLFKIPPWLAKKKGCTTELRGEVYKESGKAIFIRAYSLFTPTDTCRVCGRPLTNPLSVTRGVGPICMSKMFGLSYSDEDEAELDRACMEAEERLFEIWLPKGYISYEKFVRPV